MATSILNRNPPESNQTGFVQHPVQRQTDIQMESYIEKVLLFLKERKQEMCSVNIYPGNCPACRQDTNLCGWHLRSVITLGCRLRQPPATRPSHNSKVWPCREASTAQSSSPSPSTHRPSRCETLMGNAGIP